MKKTLFSFLAILFIFTPTKAQIVINEVHYNPATSQGSDSYYEFVELFNAGQSDVDLTGYVFMLEDDDRTYQKKTTLGSLTIAAGSYAIISTDTSDEAGYTAYKNLSVPVYRLNEGKAGSAAHTMLINAGGKISLLNGTTNIDDVDYYSHRYVAGGNDDGSNGVGKSDELKDFTSDNSGGGTERDKWGASTADNGTPGAQNSIFNGTAWTYLMTNQEKIIPQKTTLLPSYPNPFNPTTTLRFDLPEVSDITLTIYNMLGQKVRTFDYQNTSAGYHSVKWNATNDYGDPVGAGVYLYQLQTKDFVKTRKMVLLK